MSGALYSINVCVVHPDCADNCLKCTVNGPGKCDTNMCDNTGTQKYVLNADKECDGR